MADKNRTTPFNPNDISVPNGHYFALPYSVEESELILLSAPWDVTTSYNPGASQAPDAIIEASGQVDLFDALYPDGYKRGIGSLPIEESMLETSNLLRRDAERIIAHLAEGGSPTDENVKRKLARINAASEVVNLSLYEAAKEWLEKGRLVGLVGGDHSTPLGVIKAVAQQNQRIGILHIDAHADLREAYEGFTYSHASIMYNVITQVPQVEKLVQVGLRDFCQGEVDFQQQHPQIVPFTDQALHQALFEGVSWHAMCQTIISHLPEKVYVSFDIDGLSPDNCPGTGTPVPGGLSFNQAVYLLKGVVETGRQIVGFDLTEVSPQQSNEWDANVGARMLFKMCNLALLSKKQSEMP